MERKGTSEKMAAGSKIHREDFSENLALFVQRKQAMSSVGEATTDLPQGEANSLSLQVPPASPAPALMSASSSPRSPSWKLDAQAYLEHFDQGSIKGTEERENRDRGDDDTSYSWIYTCCSDYDSRLDAYNDAQRDLIESYMSLDVPHPAPDGQVAVIRDGVEEEAGLLTDTAAEAGTSGDAITIGIDAGTSKGTAGKGSDTVTAPVEALLRLRALLISRAINASFFLNVLIFFVKLAAAASSGSFSVIASTVDSGLDIATGAIIYVTQLIVRKKSPYKYPQGKARMEPLGVIVFACIMGVSMLQLMQEAIVSIVNRASPSDTSGPIKEMTIDDLTMVILVANIALKLCLYIGCRYVHQKTGNAMVEAYADDHRNDTLSNICVVITAVIAARNKDMWYLDPAFAICLCIFIVVNWALTAKEQVQMLAGLSAKPDFLSKLTYLACNHDERVLFIDTVRAYHFGTKFLVECDIVLPEAMPLKEAHDIGEALQVRIEQMEDVERAFVHLDYEWDHKAEHGNPYADAI